jgi:hypothetical protein
LSLAHLARLQVTANVEAVARPHVRGEMYQAAGESSRLEPVGADVRQERPQFRLPGSRELQDIVDDMLHLVALVLLEENERARRGQGDGVQRL